jgi:hypothetical protein
MRFDIVSDPVKVARIQKRLADRERRLVGARGALVRYEMPALPNAFPRLSRVLDSSPYQARFTGIHYHIRSRHRKIELLLPAADYPKFVFRAVADRRYAIELGLGRLGNLERWIERYYQAIQEPALRTDRPSFGVTDKVYALKAEVGNILLLVRGGLDTVATLLHFLNGPTSSLYQSFAAFVNDLKKPRAAGARVDSALQAYVEDHLDWFRTLREYHDYVTQYGSIDVSFYEPREGVVRTYLQDALQVHEVVAPVLAGLDSFCEFVDGHFAARIAGSAEASQGSTGMEA